ncbi:MAG: hypothetical protein Kow00107_11740 [Planctomycetota bacterium]
MSPLSLSNGRNWRFLLLDSPDNRNAISNSVMDALENACALSEADGRGLCIASANSYFSSGADLTELAGLTRSGASARSMRAQNLCARLAHGSFRSIAVVRGHCIGKGLEIALACQRIVADKSAWFMFPEMLMGFLPGSGGEKLLKRRVIGAFADEILVTGRKVDAEEAQRIGLVDRVLHGLDTPPPEELLDNVFEASGGVLPRFEADPAFAAKYADIITSSAAQKLIKARLSEIQKLKAD